MPVKYTTTSRRMNTTIEWPTPELLGFPGGGADDLPEFISREFTIDASGLIRTDIVIFQDGFDFDNIVNPSEVYLKYKEAVKTYRTANDYQVDFIVVSKENI